MSKRSDALLSDMLEHRWSVTHAPAAGATVVASVSAPQSDKSRHNVEHFSFSIKNMAAAAHTVTVAVRDASVAGTVRMSWDKVVAAAASAEVIMDSLCLQGAKGKGIHITMDTVLASVKATVNMSGWTDQSSDY